MGDFNEFIESQRNMANLWAQSIGTELVELNNIPQDAKYYEINLNNGMLSEKQTKTANSRPQSTRPNVCDCGRTEF